MCIYINQEILEWQKALYNYYEYLKSVNNGCMELILRKIDNNHIGLC